MNPCTIKNITFQAGKTAICTPICISDLAEVEDICDLIPDAVDVIEWRMDYLRGNDINDWLAAAHRIEAKCFDRVLLATWRTKREGGVQDCEPTFYQALNEAMITATSMDLIDVELFAGEAIVTTLVDLAHAHHKHVLLSNHDWKQTPCKESMKIRLHAMQKMGADLVKLAVMPQTIQDVWNLLEVSSAYANEQTSKPMITMAMGELGKLTRIAGKYSGSCMSFASLEKESAPGQLPFEALSTILSILEP